MFYGKGETFAEKFANNFLECLEERLAEQTTERVNKNKIVVELPGFKKSEISLEFADKILTMTAKNDRRGTVTKRWAIDRQYYTEPVFSAKFEDWILTIEIPLASTSKKTKIDIS